MSLEQASLVSQIIAALAVSASLLFLAVQARQSANSARLDSLNLALGTHVKLIADTTATDSDAELFRKFVSGLDMLSLNERARAHAVMLTRLASFNQVRFLHESGVLPSDEFRAMQGVFISMLKTKGGRQWWKLFRDQVPTRLDTYITEVLDNPAIGVEAFDQRTPWLFNSAL